MITISSRDIMASGCIMKSGNLEIFLRQRWYKVQADLTEDTLTLLLEDDENSRDSGFINGRTTLENSHENSGLPDNIAGKRLNKTVPVYSYTVYLFVNVSSVRLINNN